MVEKNKQTLLGSVIVVGLCVVLVAVGIAIQENKRAIESFSAVYFEPYAPPNIVIPGSGQTYATLANHLIWVACNEPLDGCLSDPCLTNALNKNTAAVELFCHAVMHDCINPCMIAANCQSMSLLRPCPHEPSDWLYSYAEKINKN